MYDDILGPAPKKKKFNPMDGVQQGPSTRPNLKKLTGDNISALEDDDDGDYYVKLTRLYQPRPKTQWKGKCKLHIQKTKDGRLGVLTPKPDTIPIPWAEYCESDIEDSGECVCEDYLMEIWKEVP